MSKERVVSCLIAAAGALRAAEDEITADTSYLRDELRVLLEDMDVLLEKLRVEQKLLDTRGVLHD